MPKPATSKILEFLLLAGLAARAFAQTPPAASPRRSDVQEEIQSLQQSNVDVSGLRAEYKNLREAAALAGSEPVLRAMPAPASAISAQRLRHHPPKAAQKAFVRGVTARRKGRQTEAIENFTNAVSLDPSYVEARLELGVMYARAGDVSKALEQFERASELEPNSSVLHFNRAWALLSLGRAAEAEREARRVLALSPQDVDAHHLIDLALLAQGSH
jgi:tetratricopeptide (TPR) repeat protein